MAVRILLAAVFILSGSVSAADKVDFNRDVRPILSDKCIACHGPDESHREADLRLDQKPSGAALAAIEAGYPERSELVRRIISRDPDEMMPPPKLGKKLSVAEINILKRWIEQGAQWETHWAYVPPVRHNPPALAQGEVASNWIDNFLFDRQRRAGVQAAGIADRVTLLRRLSFDLRGLPPSPTELDEWLADKESNAWERWADRFLASQAFGERMAVYWLDLVRYADTVGYHGDQEHHISPYRDWVIDAFNDDLPFDQFTREQLAGDLLPQATIDQKIASGYNRLLQTSHEGGVQEKEYLAMYAADRTRNLSAVWMGGTLGCAQCHNHKFDPYTQKDFYALIAAFSDIDEAQHLKKGSDKSPTVRAPEIPVLSRRERTRIAELEKHIAGLKAQPEAARKEQSAKLAAAEKELAEAKKSARLTMVTVSIAPRTVRLLPRGNWMDDSGPVMQSAVPEFLGKAQTTGERVSRLDVANWLMDKDRGAGLLTARVMVNRLWYLMFGSGLCRSLEDFGGQGEPPDQPELLDRLAYEFVEGGWSVKHLMKHITLSQAYQRASYADKPGMANKDPENRLFARQGRFRLSAEFIRDNALAMSGLLVSDVGGAGVRPYQPAGYYKYLNFPTRDYVAHTDQRQWRRGVYMHWQRQFLHPMLKAFDAPRREECTAQRSRSNTPLSALVLLNDPTFLEAARVFAARTLKDGGTDDASRLNFAFRWATSRSPNAEETAALQDFLKTSRNEFSDEAAAKELLSTGLAPQTDDVPNSELAAWTSVMRLLLNLAETNLRS